MAAAADSATREDVGHLRLRSNADVVIRTADRDGIRLGLVIRAGELRDVGSGLDFLCALRSSFETFRGLKGRFGLLVVEA